jgi:hypothetical protein
MIEILIAYLTLGILTAVAQGRWRLQDLARSTLIWPALLPGMVRGDPSPLDAPALAAWQTRIRAALTSLESAVRQSAALPDASASQRLLTTASEDLTAVARRHAELEAVLSQPENDLAEARALMLAAPPHRQPALRHRVEHIERLFAAREALETQLEAGLARVMNLAARLHLARATDAPVESLNQRLEEISMTIEGVVEAEEVLGADLSMPPDWSPQVAPQRQPDDAPRPAAVKEADPEARRSFEDAFAPETDSTALVRLSPVRPDEGAPGAETSTASSSWPMIAGILGLTCASLMYRVLVMGGLEQTSALFIGLPAILAVFVALLPPGRSYTAMLLKITTLLLLLSGVLLAEGFICIVMAAPLFYAVGTFFGVLLDLLYPSSPTARVLLLSPLLVMSMEGVHPLLDSDRAEVITVSRAVSMAPADITAALAARPVFDDPLPLPLQAGFPRPVSALGEGLDVGDRRLIHFAGGEGKPGALMMEVWSVEPGRVVFGCVEDSSHISHWLHWRSAEVTWRAEGGLTRVDWTMRYDRALAPAIWFAPTERLAVKIATGYLLDSLLDGRAAGWSQ